MNSIVVLLYNGSKNLDSFFFTKKYYKIWWWFTITGLVFLQALVEVGPKLWAKRLDHLVLGHLAERVTIHGAERQTQAVCIELVALHMVTDPFQNVVHRPVLWLNLSIRLTFGDSTTQTIIYINSFPPDYPRDSLPTFFVQGGVSYIITPSGF